MSGLPVVIEIDQDRLARLAGMAVRPSQSIPARSVTSVNVPSPLFR